MRETTMDKKQSNSPLRLLPGVDEVLADERVAALLEAYPRRLVTEAVRFSIDMERRRVLTNPAQNQEQLSEQLFLEVIVTEAVASAHREAVGKLRSVLNATGVVLHTNLGRALLSKKAAQAAHDIAVTYSNLELDLDTGQRGSRYALLESALTALTGAEAALVVNNNAAAVLLALHTMAAGREVVVSRGQLVEIGGSFRIPEVMAQSGAKLVEVGATNKTHPGDYRQAVRQDTALLLQVHTSNYRIVGFAREVTLEELVGVGREFSLPVMSDLGSGSLIDLAQYGLPPEPTVPEVVATGVDVVTFSGDKLLGGPQAGIIVGKALYIESMKKNPLLRALRVDKLTIAALEATLRTYLDLDKAVKELPTLAMLAASPEELLSKAAKLARLIEDTPGFSGDVTVQEGVSLVGGGAFPTAELPTKVVEIKSEVISAGAARETLRQGNPAVLCLVREDRLILDPRTLQEHELAIVATAIGQVIK
jgi:L-seryl-tRNA(Ser) seleniumtransferase